MQAALPQKLVISVEEKGAKREEAKFAASKQDNLIDFRTSRGPLHGLCFSAP
jgi:hypothetical protein